MATRDNSGSISPNGRKEKDSHPDLKGSATIDGVDYWVSGWNNKNDRGEYIGLRFERKQKPTEDERPMF